MRGASPHNCSYLHHLTHPWPPPTDRPHSPGHHGPVISFAFIQGSFPCSNKEMTSGLEMEIPVYRKRNGAWSHCFEIQAQSFVTKKVKKLQGGRCEGCPKDGKTEMLNNTTHFQFHKAQSNFPGNENWNSVRKSQTALEIHNKETRKSRRLAWIMWTRQRGRSSSTNLLLCLQFIPQCSWPCPESCSVPRELTCKDSIIHAPCFPIGFGRWEVSQGVQAETESMQVLSQPSLHLWPRSFGGNCICWPGPFSVTHHYTLVSSLQPFRLEVETGSHQRGPWLLIYRLALCDTISLPSETKFPKFSKVTSLYKSLWAGFRHFHSSWENSTATSLNVTNPWNNKPMHD